MKEKKKVEIFHIRTSPQLKAAAIKRAEEESRSLTSYVENLIRKDIERNEKK